MGSCAILRAMNVEQDGTLRELRLQEQMLELQLVRIRKAIQAYLSVPVGGDPDFWEGLNLDHHQTTDAVREALTYAVLRGRPGVSLGDLEAVLGKYQVRTSGTGKLLSETNNPRIPIIHSITGSKGRKVFRFNPSGRAKNSDVVSLVKPPKGAE